MNNQEALKQQGDVNWNIANLLRGPYRPPQYRRVVIPLTVLRRLDCVLEASKDEVLDYRPDAWIDHQKTKVGFEIPFNRHFYEYKPPRPLADIEHDIAALLKEVTA